MQAVCSEVKTKTNLQVQAAEQNLPLKSLRRRLLASSTQFNFLVTNISTLPTTIKRHSVV